MRIQTYARLMMSASLLLAVSAAPFAQASSRETVKALLTQPSMNVFRRFTVDRAKMMEFYGEVLALRPMPAINMPGGGQMSRFQVGTSEIKLTTTRPESREQKGGVKEVTGLRVFTFFFPDEAALTTRFKEHGFAAPVFHASGSTRVATVQDPDGEWVELIVVPGAPASTLDRLEVGLTVSDLEKSRAFYREFIGLEELPPVDGGWLGAKKHPYRHGTTTVNVWTFGKGLPANTNTAGIQYVGRHVDTVDARAKAWGVKITQPLSNFSAALRTIWLADPDGITNYFAQVTRGTQP